MKEKKKGKGWKKDNEKVNIREIKRSKREMKTLIKGK
jgi:hypothetical protein